MAVLEQPQFVTEDEIRTPSNYERVMGPLMERPEEWAKIGDYASSNSAYQAATNLRHGRYRIPGDPGDWEFRVHENSVYARYLVTEE